MDSILSLIQTNFPNWEIDTILGLHNELTNIYINQEDKVYYSITGPHSGNGNKFLVRADAAATHDRWSNCDWEYFFDSAEQVKAFLEMGGFPRIADYVLNAATWICDMATYIADALTGASNGYWEERTHEYFNN